MLSSKLGAVGILLGLSHGANAQWVPVPLPQSPGVQQTDKGSPEYRSGFSDGCMHATFGQIRNEGRFKSDISYHQGWVAGFNSCYAHQTINTNGDPNGPLKNIF